MSNLLKHWYVVTPTYDTVVPILDDGTGPIETGADCIEIEATTGRDAIALGVREMLRGGKCDQYGSRFRWCIDARNDGCSPYAGVKAYGDEVVHV